MEVDTSCIAKEVEACRASDTIDHCLLDGLLKLVWGVLVLEHANDLERDGSLMATTKLGEAGDCSKRCLDLLPLLETIGPVKLSVLLLDLVVDNKN